MFTYAHVKWFYGQSEHGYYLNYFIIIIVSHDFPYSVIPLYIYTNYCTCRIKSMNYEANEHVTLAKG